MLRGSVDGHGGRSSMDEDEKATSEVYIYIYNIQKNKYLLLMISKYLYNIRLFHN